MIGGTAETKMSNIISFELVEIDGGALSLTPCIDGTPLTTLISQFEEANGYTDPAGGYAGIVPSEWGFGPLLPYFCGVRDHRGISDRPGDIFVLGCQCGEVGCWPLISSVSHEAGGYKWSGFNQPHRKERNYENFGPFEFEKGQYEAAVRGAILKLKQSERA